tara:strand:+ start:540 stop:1169 length:630 start_codon:yes stop_codon:yes gene_type:complete
MWKNPGTITKGLGKLTPQVWRGVMSAADFVHKNKRDIEKLIKFYILDERKRTSRPWFLAKLTKGKRVAPNRYIYAWKRIQLTSGSDSTPAKLYNYSEDAAFTSAEGGNDFAYAAINTMEIENTSSLCAPGVNQGHQSYPEKFMLMPIGGVVPQSGDDPEPNLNEEFDLLVQPVVQMWFARTPMTASDAMKVRYVFTSANTHDGAECDTQ